VIKHSVVIDRPAEEVFAYLDQLDRHGEWQDSLLSAKVETEGPTRVGTRVVERRKVPGGARDIPYEITEHEPPRTASFRGTAGPVRPVGTVTVDRWEVELAHDARARPGGTWHRQAVRTPRPTPGRQRGTGKPREVQATAREQRPVSSFELRGTIDSTVATSDRKTASWVDFERSRCALLGSPPEGVESAAEVGHMAGTARIDVASTNVVPALSGALACTRRAC